MKSDILNQKIRDVIENLISDGFLKYDIASVTFGSNRMDQLAKFLEGRDIGIKPLQTIFDAIGYEIHIVPVLKNNIVESEKMSETANEAVESLSWILFDYLENKKNKHKKIDPFDVLVDNIVNTIEQERLKNFKTDEKDDVFDEIKTDVCIE